MADSSIQNLNDQDLVRAILHENPEFFGELIDRYEQKLLRYIRRITNVPKHEAEDIVQDVFIKAYENLNGFDQSFSFSSWIYRICHNHVISTYRKKRTKKEKGFIEIEDAALANIASEIHFLQEIYSEESKQAIQKTLEEMSTVYKEIIVLKFFEEKTYEEMSDILKKPVGTIGTLVFRAKKEFIKYWNKQHDIN